jgi:hypothetical protein
LAPDTCNWEQRTCVAGRYTRLMFTEKTKPLLFVTWVIAVGLAAIGLRITSVPNLMVVLFVAIVPPLVVGYFWRAPEETLSESIHDARR